MMTQALNNQVLDFIRKYKEAHAFSPSVGDIAIGCKLRTSQVRDILDDLEDSGQIVVTKASIRLAGAGREAVAE